MPPNLFQTGNPTRRPTYGNSSTYQSSVKMNLYGQEKRSGHPMGSNPNDNTDHEYIVNLQQQLHFMDLEAKILKEKVKEDESKSGIGALFDDDKTSHQHIDLLKTKYAAMKRDHDRAMKLLDKQKIEVSGDHFVLSAQLGILKEQNL